LGSVNSWEIAEGLHDAVVLVIDNKGSAAHHVSAVSHLSATAADLARGSGFLNITIRTQGLESSNGLLGLGQLLNGVVHDQRNFWNCVNVVAASLHERGQGRGSQGRGDGIALLVGVDLSVPSSPGLGRGEHPTLAALVTKGTLSSAGGTTTGHTGDTRHGSTGSPRLGGVAHTGFELHGIRLPGVLANVCVHKLDNVLTNGGQENRGLNHLGHGFIGVPFELTYCY